MSKSKTQKIHILEADYSPNSLAQAVLSAAEVHDFIRKIPADHIRDGSMEIYTDKLHQPYRIELKVEL